MPFLDRRKKKTYAMGFLLALALVVLLAYPRVSSRGWTTVEVFADFVCLILFTRAIAGFLSARDEKKEERLIDLYDNQCDPEAFVREGADYVSRISLPYGERDIWFLAPYAQALIDVGRRDEARRIADSLFDSVAAATSTRQKASMMINMEPLVAMLFGLERAVQLLEDAQKLLDDDPAAEDFGRREYVKWRMNLLQSSAAGSDDRLIELLREVRVRTTCSWRLRVMCAIDEASAYYRCKDHSRERDCLEFVVEHGNLLPCVRVAQARLEQLDVSACE